MKIQNTQSTSVKQATWYRKFERFVALSKLGARSQKTYLCWIRQIDCHYPDTPTTKLPPDQVLDFLLHLQTKRKLAPSTLNQALCAMRSFFRDHLDHSDANAEPWDIWRKIKIKRVEPLPHVLTCEEVDSLLGVFREGRFRAFFTVVYQCGLRLSEATHLRPRDIKGDRLVIRVNNTKGGKPREVPITPILLHRLRRFWKAHGNRNWLFPGYGRCWKSSQMTKSEAMGAGKKPMSNATVQAALKVAVAECGLHKKHEKVCTHTLRHSYATHLLDSGTSVRQVAAYLGHSSLKQTMVYLHLTEISEEKARQALTTLAGH